MCNEVNKCTHRPDHFCHILWAPFLLFSLSDTINPTRVIVLWRILQLRAAADQLHCSCVCCCLFTCLSPCSARVFICVCVCVDEKHIWMSVYILLCLYGSIISCIVRYPQIIVYSHRTQTGTQIIPEPLSLILDVWCAGGNWLWTLDFSSPSYFCHFLLQWNTNAHNRPSICIATVYGGCAERLILSRVKVIKV